MSDTNSHLLSATPARQTIRRRSLYRRLVVPFVSTLLAGTLTALLVTHFLYSRHALTHLKSRLQDTVEVLASGNFPLTPELLWILSRLTGAGFAMRSVAGGIENYGIAEGIAMDLAGTAIDREGSTALHRVVGSATAEPQLVTASGSTFLTLSHTLPSGRAVRYTSVTAVMDVSAWQRVLSRALFMLAAAAVPGIGLLAWVGHRISRSVTTPVTRLADMARAIADGDRAVRTDIHRDDEIGRLAADLDRMADHLAAYERDIAATSKAAARGEMAARLAHEIRNPLAAIKLQLELLAQPVVRTDTKGARGRRPQDRSGGGGLPSADTETLNDLLREVARLELIVSSTLQQRRSSRPVVEPTDLAGVVSDLVDLLRPQLEHRRISLELRFADGLPAAGADPGLVRQVLFNLLLNASDAMPEGGRVRLTVRRHRNTKGMEILVEDTGPGIPKSQMDDLFTSGTSTKPDGFGIGLPLSRELMAQQGGALDYCPGELGGACFRLLFEEFPSQVAWDYACRP